MKNYKHVLVAVELMPENDAVLIEQAQKIAQDFGATVNLLHVIEYLFDYEYIHDYGSHSIGIGFGEENAPDDTEKDQELESAEDDYGSHSIGLSVSRTRHPITLEKDMVLGRVRQEMLKLGDSYGISESKIGVTIGSAKFAILEEAERLGSDLIILGSHGRYGSRAILGSTANAVLHGSKCDTLVMRFN